MGSLITVGSFSYPWEAHLAKSRLESEGIEAVLADEHTVGMNWLYSNAVGGVKVRVAARDIQRARQILSSEIDQSLQEALTDPDVVCPSCGSNRIGHIQPGKRWVYLSWLLLGFPIFFLRERMRCNQCGFIWRADKLS